MSFASSCFGSEVLVAGPDFVLVKHSEAHLLISSSVSIFAPNSWFSFLR
jgi:hypothetical protein